MTGHQCGRRRESNLFERFIVCVRSFRWMLIVSRCDVRTNLFLQQVALTALPSEVDALSRWINPYISWRGNGSHQPKQEVKIKRETNTSEQYRFTHTCDGFVTNENTIQKINIIYSLFTPLGEKALVLKMNILWARRRTLAISPLSGLCVPSKGRCV